MREFRTRASRRRFFLMIAALSVIILTASSPIYSAVRGSHVTGRASAWSDAAAGRTTAQSDCSNATALELATRFDLAALDAGDSVARWFCGAFVGPGSQAMVIATTPGTCGLNGWAVFSFTGGDWRLVGSRHSGWIFAVAAVGSDIRETAPVPTGKFQCPLTNGKPRSRLWHWDGTRFTATPWKLTTKPKPKPRTLHLYYFESPSHNLWCDLGDEGEVFCRSYNRPHCARLTFDGRVRIWNDRSCGYKKPGGRGDPVLAYGQRDEDGRYRCTSEKKGITCTVMAGAAKGRGFLINAAGVRRVGP